MRVAPVDLERGEVGEIVGRAVRTLPPPCSARVDANGGTVDEAEFG